MSDHITVVDKYFMYSLMGIYMFLYQKKWTIFKNTRFLEKFHVPSKIEQENFWELPIYACQTVLKYYDTGLLSA